jgi:hypothetical protein
LALTELAVFEERIDKDQGIHRETAGVPVAKTELRA